MDPPAISGVWCYHLPVECAVTSGMCCYQWNVLILVECGVTSGVWCYSWSVVLLMECGATNGVYIYDAASGVWCCQWSVASRSAHDDLVSFDHFWSPNEFCTYSSHIHNKGQSVSRYRPHARFSCEILAPSYRGWIQVTSKLQEV